MFFEGLPLPHLGGTVLLRGASKLDLIKIKQTASYFLFTCYNWRLEKSYLMDEFAQPPHQKDEFFDDSKESTPELPISKLQIPEEPIKLQNENKIKLELFSDGENDTEFFSMSKKSNSESSNNDHAKAEKIENNHKVTSESRKITLESASDFSDPLLSGNVEDDVFKSNNSEKFSVAELPFSNDFRKALDDTILCISPYLNFTLPYLETEMGKKCKLRSFFPSEIFFSNQIGNKKKVKAIKDTTSLEVVNNQEQDLKMKPPHPFITARFRTSADSNEFQSLLAHFRACGGRFEHRNIMYNDDTDENDFEENKKLIAESEHGHLDALDPLNHQRLAILFCSFSHMSNNAPAFCVKM